MMIIKTPQSLPGLISDSLLTALAWLAFLYLLIAGVQSVLTAPTAARATPLTSSLLPDVRTLLAYAIVSSCIGLLLYLWASYNAWRFNGLDRRKPHATLTDRALALSFHLNPAQVAGLHHSRNILLHHAEDGKIQLISLQEAQHRSEDQVIDMAAWRRKDTSENKTLPHTTDIHCNEMNNNRLHSPARGLPSWRPLP